MRLGNAAPDEWYPFDGSLVRPHLSAFECENDVADAYRLLLPVDYLRGLVVHRREHRNGDHK